MFKYSSSIVQIKFNYSSSIVGCSMFKYSSSKVGCSSQCNHTSSLLLPVWTSQHQTKSITKIIFHAQIKPKLFSTLKFKTKIIFNAQIKPSNVLLSDKVSFRVLFFLEEIPLLKHRWGAFETGSEFLKADRRKMLKTDSILTISLLAKQCTLSVKMSWILSLENQLGMVSKID